MGMLRWAWTQLTSMRTALFLLLLLAVAAVPGSLFPQRPANPSIVTQYIKDNPDYGKILDSLQLYDVYSSAWFSAIYILLFISLIGCVVPRAIAHYKAMRSQPPRTPARLSRLPEYGTLVIPADAGIPASRAIADAAGLLKKRGYRVDVRDRDGARPSVGAERGFLREVGNLVFHTSLIGVLVSVAIGGLFGYSGQRILVEGDTFVNTLVGYDQFTPGTNFQSSQLQPYSVQLDKFQITFDRESQGKIGQPIDFKADVTTKETPDAPAKKEVLKVNDPLTLGGTSMYLTGNGYAPVVTIRDGAGNVAMQGPVVAKLQGDNYYSSAVIKVPDAKPDQLAFAGFFLPTAFITEEGVSFSGDPELFNPQLTLNSYYGDLGLDDGAPQNVFELDVKKLTPLNARNLDAGGIVLAPGDHLHPARRQGLHQLRRREALRRRRHPPQSGPAVRPDLRAPGGGRPGHFAVREPPPRLGPDRNPRGRPHHGRIRSPGPRRGPPAGRGGSGDPQTARGCLGSGGLPVRSQRDSG